MAQFIGLEGPGAGKMFPLSETTANRIGDGEIAGVPVGGAVLPDVRVEVACRDGSWVLSRVESGVRVEVNGAPVEGERTLSNGDTVQIGDAVLLYGEGQAGAEDLTESGETGGITVGLSEIRLTVEARQRYYQSTQKLMEDLQRTRDPARYLSLFLKVTNALVSQLDLGTLLTQILGIIFEVVPAERGTVFLFDSKEKMLRPMATRTTPWTKGRGASDIMASRTLIREVLESKAGHLTRDAMAETRFDVATSILDQSIHSALCVPLVSREEEVLGVIYVDTITSGLPPFDEDHLKFLTGIAMEAALAIANARLVVEVAEKRRLESELDLARSIQMNLVPGRAPETDGIELAGLMIPAREVGGDYYDFVRSEADQRLYIAIGDVSGKGVPASLIMVMARCFFRTLLGHATSTRDIVIELNRLLHADMRMGTFMSMLVLACDPREGVLRWTGAGHEHLLVYRAATRSVERTKAGGMVLGLRTAADRFYCEKETRLGPGDVLLLYTDGVTEALNDQGKMFGLDRTAALLEKHGHENAEALVQAVLGRLKAYMASARQVDDITLVAIRKT